MCVNRITWVVILTLFYTSMADFRHTVENERRLEQEVKKMMVLPRESIETALANNLNVLNMLRKSHIQLMLTTKEEELEMFNREWPAWENF